MRTKEEILKDEFGFIPTSIVGITYDKIIIAMETYANQQVKNLELSDVDESLKCDCKHSNSCRYETVVVETKELCRHME